MKQFFLLSFVFFFSFSVFAQPPGNDACANRTTLYSSSACINVTGNLRSATNAAPTGTCGGATGTTTYDVWYSFTAPSTPVTISVTKPGTSTSINTATTYMQVLSSSDNSCTALNFTSIACQNIASSLTLSTLTAGNLYYIRVYVTTNPNTGAAATWDFNICLTSNPPNTRLNEVFTDTIVARNSAGFDSPWEITYEPREDSLWITENRTYRIRKMHPNGNSRVILDLSDAGGFTANYRRAFTTSVAVWPQGGLMGLAIHPDFLAPSNPKNFVYTAYVRDFVGQGPSSGTKTQTVTNPYNGEAVKGDLHTTFLVRFTYNTTTKALESPVVLCDTIPGSGDHNSGRLIIAPMTPGGTDYFLFYSVGDVGAGQFYNAERTMKSQLTNSYEGKILRFNLEEDGDAAQNVAPRNANYNRWIPNTNPYNGIAPVTGQSAVWSIGHRNVQGLAYANGNLYGSSHGPFSDDEVNILQGNKNYGHPLIVGFKADANYNGVRAATATFPGWGNEYNGVGPNPTPLACSLPVINETTTTLTNYQDPIYSFFGGTNGANNTTVTNIYNLGALGNNNALWPSIAPSGMDAYTNTKIPGWKNSLFLASLKRGYIMRIKPNAAGTGVDQLMGSDTVTVANTTNRFRDLAFDPNGWSFYGVVDRSGSTSGPTATNSVSSSCPGCVIKYTFLGYRSSGTAPNTTSNIPTDIAIDSSTSASCVTATTVTINAANKNNTLWVPITGPNGNLIAEINANGNNLNNVNTSFFTRTGNPVRTGFGNKYGNRNVTISIPAPSTAMPFATPVSVRLYLTAKELEDFKNTPGSGVTGIANIGVYKNNDACGTAIASTSGGGLIAGVTSSPQSAFGHALQFNVSSFSSFYFLSTASTLPVDFITISAAEKNNAANIQWTVTNQGNISSYIVERSIDNRNFDAVGTVAAVNGNGDINYSFVDYNAARFSSVVYYRVRAVEQSGQFKFTNIVNVAFGAVIKEMITLYPNPANDKTSLSIASNNDETAQVRIIDNTGRVVNQRFINIVKGKNNFELNISNLSTGLYYIEVNGKTINQKIKLIKQ
jgi:trimeric autotransporter adhesin